MNINDTARKLASKLGLRLFEDRVRLESKIETIAFIEANFESDMFEQLDPTDPDYLSKQDWHEYRLTLERMLEQIKNVEAVDTVD